MLIWKSHKSLPQSLYLGTASRLATGNVFYLLIYLAMLFCDAEFGVSSRSLRAGVKKSPHAKRFYGRCTKKRLRFYVIFIWGKTLEVDCSAVRVDLEYREGIEAAQLHRACVWQLCKIRRASLSLVLAAYTTNLIYLVGCSRCGRCLRRRQLLYCFSCNDGSVLCAIFLGFMLRGCIISGNISSWNLTADIN